MRFVLLVAFVCPTYGICPVQERVEKSDQEAAGRR